MCIYAMFSLLLLISVAKFSGAYDFTVRCTNDSSMNGISFEPVEDIIGRYRLEQCTPVKADYKQWEVVIYYRNLTSSCIRDYRLAFQMQLHSTNFENLHIDNSCTHACFSKNFDLIFSACYSFETKFSTAKDIEYSRGRSSVEMVAVNNSYTKQQFTDNTITVEFIARKGGMTILWHTGIPVQEFNVEICPGNVTKHENLNRLCKNVSAHCAAEDSWRAVRCSLPAPTYCVSMQFTHVAPWISGSLGMQSLAHIPHIHCTEPGGVGVSESSWAGAACAGGVLLAALAALAARQAHVARRALRARKHVLKLWLQNNGNESRASPAPGAAAARAQHVLLLHAREDAAGQRLVDALTAILQRTTPGQVYSVYSPSVMCLAAPAPAEWLRAALARRDVSVVLLQTPALQALYAAGAGAGAGAPQPPRFPARVVPRTPAFGDTLLQYALRLLTDTDVQHDYNKIYIAQLTELPTEVLPHVVPYRRYLLPEAAALLAHDAAHCGPGAGGRGAGGPGAGGLGAGGPGAGAGDEPLKEGMDVEQELLTEAVAFFVDLVKENPGYLMEELVAL